MRQTVYAILSIVSITIIGYGASHRLGFWGLLPIPGTSGVPPGVYQSLGGTQFYDDHRDMRPPLAYDLERACYGFNRSITGGTIEPMGTFRVEKAVPYGARIKVLSGRYQGDGGYVKAWELSGGRAKRIGGLSPDSARKDDGR